ncbi:M14 family metallopeptidase [uncultured Alsobacter sp.]|uniref:M14 family metallopeptidase n=1 Tax=uncultured Alsobacter sp. TaxID=1748258 RepID=UPI0025D6ED30|nr:M14 family metallopeptidase [uncultured Alsobacter sp.]
MIGVTMDATGAFPADYASSAERFRTTAARLGASLARYDNPGTGPAGEPLATDTAWFGPRDAERVLLLVAATHGVEGFCGAGAKMDWMTHGGPASLPAGTAALLVHAINPYGFAWLRRTTEEGVDLNRNCIRFEDGLPDNPGYRELAAHLVPPSLDAAALARADAALADYKARHGLFAYDVARSSGQYTHPEGLFYGGTGPTWSLRTIEAVCRDNRLGERKGVAVIDYHTGLGPFGYGEPIVGHKPGTAGQARCRAWYGSSLGEPLLGTSSSVPIAGLTQYAWERLVGADRLTFIALEFGTFASDVGTVALRAEHWLHARGPVDWASEEARAIKAALRRFYYPGTRDWQELVLLRSRQILAQATAGLQTAHP